MMYALCVYICMQICEGEKVANDDCNKKKSRKTVKITVRSIPKTISAINERAESKRRCATQQYTTEYSLARNRSTTKTNKIHIYASCGFFLSKKMPVN